MNQTVTENNKRIAKNTLYMYFRMGITLLISLFTARVVLNALGVNDYGLYNVVGGFIGILGYLNMLLSQSSSRFITFGLGKGDIANLKKTFSACMTIHLIISIITLILGETIGLWFVNNKLMIDPGRLNVANYIYQLSLFNAVLNIMQTPFQGCITAHEKMSIYAYMSIFDVVMKLLIIYLLLCFNGDKLILYSTFYFSVSIITFIIYRIYCLKKFEECNMKLRYDKKLYQEIFRYIGWNTLGSFAFMANNQGITVLLNMFFGTFVNAARGIAMNLCNYINQFVSGFQIAANPQIIKYYAQGDTRQMNTLIKENAKYSSYLILIIGIPIFIETESILMLWLGQVPEYTVWFVRLSIIQILIQSIDSPVGNGIHAYGKMRLPNLTSAIVYLSILPISFVLLKLGTSPITSYIIIIIAYPVALAFDLWILNKYSQFNILEYVKEVIIKMFIIILISSLLPAIIHQNLELGFLRLIIVGILSIITTISAIYYIGLTPSMRKKCVNKVKFEFSKRFN